MHPAAASAIAAPYVIGLCALLILFGVTCLVLSVRGAR